MLAMAFGQVGLAAYAGAAPRPVTPLMLVTSVHAATHGEAGQGPCAAMQTPTDAPQANACEVRCTDGVTASGQPDWPQVTLALLPVPTLALAKLATVHASARLSHAPLPGAPPPTVRFCRLLI